MMEFKEKDTTSGNNGKDKKKRMWSIFGGKKTARKVFGIPLGELECYENTRIPILTVHTIEYLKTFGRPPSMPTLLLSIIPISPSSFPHARDRIHLFPSSQGLDAEGLFRIPGSQKFINEMKLEYESSGTLTNPLAPSLAPHFSFSSYH